MNRNTLCYSLSFLASLAGCAPTATPGASSRSANTGVNYNGYNDDLSAARPVYTVKATAPVSSTPVSVTKADAVVAPVRKPVATPAPSSPTVEAIPVNKRLDALLDTIAQRNRSVRYAPGYRIQIYVGNEREEADAAKLQVYQSFPQLSSYLSYKQPTYRLKVGDFMRRLDAEWYLGQLKQQFTSVILQPDKVDIRRSLSIK